MPDDKKVFRNELKYVITHSEADILKDRLKYFLEPDSHAGEEGYSIRSLYFDDIDNSAYEQKIMGVFARKKWRIRIYNGTDGRIALERKIKNGNYIYKEAALLTRGEYDMIMSGMYGFLLKRDDSLCREFYTELMCNLLRPRVIVDYDRYPLIAKEGTVRVTFDSHLHAAVGSLDIFDGTLAQLPAMDEGCEVMEVKYTEYLPYKVRDVIRPMEREYVAFSKYVACFEAAGYVLGQNGGYYYEYK
ncbi:MAG: polyphosphate polymerase domain-containing protein [Lachnospiraceae bacterium]|nr:polyphosphate polymerase domain-containing protein [Lachnospiraceae bacterium]